MNARGLLAVDLLCDSGSLGVVRRRGSFGWL